MKRNEYLYRYKNEVDIPSLEICDDVLDIAECGIRSVMSNAYINAIFEQKRLRLNKKKCFQIHSVKDNSSCPELKGHDKIMVKCNETKYIGDIITSCGKNTVNVKKRVTIGMGTSTNIMVILKFGADTTKSIQLNEF